MKRKKCSVCGNKIKPVIGNTYLVREPLAPTQALTQAPKVFEAVDCPNCGHQILLAIRLPRIEKDDAS